MTATYTFDIFSTLDGFGSHHGDWGGYWGKQGPELLDRRLAVYGPDQRMVFGANTYRQFVQILGLGTEESGVGDPWVKRMTSLPATVVSSTLQGPLDWPDATVASGDAVDIVARLKEESDVPMRSHGSLKLNHALMAAGLVDRVQVTLSTATLRNSSTGPPCIPESVHEVPREEPCHLVDGLVGLVQRSEIELEDVERLCIARMCPADHGTG